VASTGAPAAEDERSTSGHVVDVDVLDVPPDPAVSKCNVNGAWLPGGSVTAAPLTVAAKAPGAPAITVTGPVAGTVCD
jgi:hypothetical protein